MKMEQTGCYEKSAHKIQKPGNSPRERIQHSEQSESLKWRTINLLQALFTKSFRRCSEGQKDCIEWFVVTAGNYCGRDKINIK
jgi:hypothetical protein